MDEQQAMVQYLPRAVPARADTGETWWTSSGTLLFSDVSGFTALSEKLARHGRAGAEEMVSAISSVFSPLLAEIDLYGGDVLKFGGDALLTFFDGPDSARRAAWCGRRLGRLLRSVGHVRTTFGTVHLGMSQGLHTGDFSFFLSGDRHRELLVTGAPVTQTLAMEAAAERGQILLSPATAAQLPAAALGPPHAGGILLDMPKRLAPQPESRPERAATVALEQFVPVALRGRLSRVCEESEHRQATVAFLQFTGCDTALDARGPAGVQHQLDELMSTVVGHAEEFGVTVICTDVGPDGGKFMLATGAPDADERDAEAMLRFGVAVLAAATPFSLRLGCNRGHVYGGRVGGDTRWTYSTMGDTVNLAARVMGKAPPGGLLATTAVLAAARCQVDSQPVPPFTVKGKSRPVDAAVVRGVAARQATVTAAPLLGRDDELHQLRSAWQRATHGQGAVVELVGETGSGKTRLVEELIAGAAPQRVLSVGGERYHRATAYFAAQLLLRTLGGIHVSATPEAAGRELAAWVAGCAPQLLDWLPLLAVATRATVASTPQVDAIAPEFRAVVLDSVVDALLRSVLDGPTLLLLEDAFWFDDASSQLFAGVLAGAASQPWLVCVTRRDEPTGLHAGLGYECARVVLRPLEKAAALALVRTTAAGAELTTAEAQALAASSAGNPFFLLQMASSWAPDGSGTLPDDVETAVAARLDRLPFAARRPLRHAAVLGTYVDLGLLRDVLGETVDEQTWQQVMGDYLSPIGRSTVRFANDLFRQVAYDSLPFRRRRELHLLAGTALEARGDLSARAALLSLHFESAGDFERTWRYAVLAGDQARAAAANHEAAALFRRALAAARASRPRRCDTGTVAESLGDVLELTGRYADASQAYAAARQSAVREADRLRLLRKEGVVRERQGRYIAALRWYTRGLRESADATEPEVLGARAALHVGVAAARYRQGKFRACVTAAMAAVDLAEAAGCTAELAHAYFLLDAALTDLRDDSAVLYRTLALPIYEELGDLVGQADVLNNIGIDAYYEGRWEDAIELYTASRSCRERAGDVVGAATADNNVGEVLCDLGRFDEAQPLFEEALRVWRRAGYAVGVALASSNLGRTHLRRGHLDLAEPLLGEAESVFDGMGAEVLRFETRVRQLEWLVAARHIAPAQRLAAELDVVAERLKPSPVVDATLIRARGELLVLAGRVEEGHEALRRAICCFEAAGMAWDVEVARRLLTPIDEETTITLSDARTGPRAAEPASR